MSNEAGTLDAAPEGLDAVLPRVVDQVALADPVALQPFYRLEKEYRDLKAKARSKGAK